MAATTHDPYRTLTLVILVVSIALILVMACAPAPARVAPVPSNPITTYHMDNGDTCYLYAGVALSCIGHTGG